MNANIFLREFRNRLKSVLIWSLALAVLVLFFFSLYPAFSGQITLMNQFMEKIPQAMRAAFGLAKVDLSSPLGFFSFLFVFVQLCLAIQAGNYGFGLVSVEESELTADFLLSKPVSRTNVLTSKLLAALTSLTITNAVIWVVSFAGITIFRQDRPYEVNQLLLMLASIVIFQLFFFGLGLVISLLVKRVRSVTPYSLGLAFGCYVLNAFSGMFADVKLEYITPFKHLDPTYIVQNGRYNTPLVLINAGVTVLSIAIGYWLYIRRDIPAVS
jgi:ABC-2 type transport system permease protein